MIKIFDEIIDGKRVIKYKMTEEEIAKAEEMKAKREEMRRKMDDQKNKNPTTT
jgi:hypothetical protein